MSKELFKELNPELTILVGDKSYDVTLARTEEEKETGLSNIDKLPEDEGMLFIYDEPQEEVYFTMADTSIDLDICFISEEGEVISVHSVKAYDKEPIAEEDVLYVLEVNIHSGIRPGDEVEEADEDFTEQDKEDIKNSQMLILDEDGNVLFRLEGGERIFSMINTRLLIKSALKAYHSDEDKDYRRVGSLIFKYLDQQDNRKPEYVSLSEE